MTTTTTKAYMTMHDAAREFPGAPDPRTIRRYIADGFKKRDGSVVRLRSVRVAGRRVIERAEFEKFIKAVTEKSL